MNVHFSIAKAWCFFCLGLVCSAGFLSADVLIPGNDPNINYYGRFAYDNPAAPAFVWSGCYIEASFPGPIIGVDLTDGQGTSQYDVYIDGVLQSPKLSVSGTAAAKYTIRSDLSSSAHTIRLILRNESQWSIKSFNGFYLADGKTLLAAPAKPTKKIEFWGDSWTAGYGVESAASDCISKLNDNSNVNEAYAMLTTNAFHAQAYIECWSGKGLYNPTPTLPHYFDSTMCEAWWYGGNRVWNFSKYTPDLVVTFMGINDYRESSTTSAGFISAYRQFANQIWGKYSSAKILIIAPNVGTANADIRSVVTAESTATHRITSMQCPTIGQTGCNWHPSISEQKTIANGLIGKIMSYMQWDTTTAVDPSGMTFSSLTASPSSFVNDAAHSVTFTANVTDANGTISSVKLDLTPLGGGSAVSMTAGANNTWTYTFNVAAGIAAGSKGIAATATDNSGNTKEQSTQIAVTGPVSILEIYTDNTIYNWGIGWCNDGAGNLSAATEITTGAYEGTNCIDFNYTIGGWYAGFGIAFDNWGSTVDITGATKLLVALKGTAGHLMTISLGYSDTTKNITFAGVTPTSSWQLYEMNLPSGGFSGLSAINFVAGGAISGTGHMYVDNVCFATGGAVATPHSINTIVSYSGRIIKSIYLTGKTISVQTTGNAAIEICNMLGGTLQFAGISSGMATWKAPAKGIYFVKASRLGSKEIRKVVIK